MFEVEYFETQNKKIPVIDFFKKLSVTEKAETFHVIELLEKYGNNLKIPYSKPLREGILELRIPTDEKNIRILYFFFIGKKAVLTHGIIKKTRETPEKEIEKAIKYKKEYMKKGKQTK